MYRNTSWASIWCNRVFPKQNDFWTQPIENNNIKIGKTYNTKSAKKVIAHFLNLEKKIISHYVIFIFYHTWYGFP